MSVVVFERRKGGDVGIFGWFVDKKWATYNTALAKAYIPGTVDYSDVEFITIDTADGEAAALALFDLAVQKAKSSDKLITDLVDKAIEWGFTTKADVYRNGADLSEIITRFFVDSANVEFVFSFDEVFNTIYYLFVQCGDNC